MIDSERLLSLEDLDETLGQRVQIINADMPRHTVVPPRLMLPGMRLQRRRVANVRGWFGHFVTGGRHE